MSYMPPIVCDHCKGVLGNKIEAWAMLRPSDDHTGVNRDGRTPIEIYEALGVERACCRMKLMSYNSMILEHNLYQRTKIHGRK